jgi:Putative restriction endonuclease
MVMATAMDWRDVDDNADPDTLKMPENPRHQRIIKAIGMVADHYLGAGFVVYRDMNWYPPDGGTAIAPDLMTLVAGVVGPFESSYRQATHDLPSPGVAVEVPSPTDTFEGLRKKAARYSSLGVDLYVVSTDSSLTAVLRVVPGSTDFVSWTGQPIAPLGGLAIDVADGEVVVLTPDGRTFTGESDVLGMMIEAEQRTAQAQAQAAQAQAQAAQAQAQAAQAQARAAALEGKLRALGVEPD